MGCAPELVEYEPPKALRHTFHVLEACKSPSQTNSNAPSKGQAKAPTVNKVDRGPDTPACKQAQHDAAREEADLEAQWRSAYAAENTARIAARQMFWSQAEFFALLATLFAAYGALWVSWQSARKQLRAYVSLTKATISDVEVGKRPMAHIILTNRGQTPAKNVRVWTSISFRDRGESVDFTIPKGQIPAGCATHGPGGEINSIVIWDDQMKVRPLVPADIVKLDNGDMRILVFGEAEYTDVFGRLQRTRYRMWHCGPNRKIGFFDADVEGNDAT